MALKNMKALIVEDEAIAARLLTKTIRENFDYIEVIGHTSSIEETVAWLQSPDKKADIIFMDVELSDGKCFEIFHRTKVDAKVIMTTAYDRYAIKAFEVNSVDYLLKPIELPALKRAVERAAGTQPADLSRIAEMLARNNAEKSYKERFLVFLNDHIVPVKTVEIAYFFSEAKDNFLVTKDGVRYLVDMSLEAISLDLNPAQFFKISRSCIVAKNAVESVTKLAGGRLVISVTSASGKTSYKKVLPDFTVSRSRTDSFIAWLAE